MLTGVPAPASVPAFASLILLLLVFFGPMARVGNPGG